MKNIYEENPIRIKIIGDENYNRNNYQHTYPVEFTKYERSLMSKSYNQEKIKHYVNNDESADKLLAGYKAVSIQILNTLDMVIEDGEVVGVGTSRINSSVRELIHGSSIGLHEKNDFSTFVLAEIFQLIIDASTIDEIEILESSINTSVLTEWMDSCSCRIEYLGQASEYYSDNDYFPSGLELLQQAQRIEYQQIIDRVIAYLDNVLSVIK